jgi:predicted O-methyltransferase YrrM
VNDVANLRQPPMLTEILRETELLGFNMSCEDKTGSILRTLAASKPGGKFLEIGTGTGVGASWILAGMDDTSTLITVELNAATQVVAKNHLGQDPRVTFVTGNAEEFLKAEHAEQFDFIFADTFTGKFILRDEALALLKIGGLYIVDDLLPQENWPEGHAVNVVKFISEMESNAALCLTKLNWASGLIVAVKVGK